jgi:Mce-associated membrane protein
VALLSYAPETLDKDLTNAKSHLTGEFLKYYSQFTDQIVAPAAKQKGVKTEATVTRAAVSQMQPDRAVVLVFVNQVTTSKDRPDPALATSSVMVTLVKQDGRWLISEFNPV